MTGIKHFTKFNSSGTAKIYWGFPKRAHGRKKKTVTRPYLGEGGGYEG
jgi:hypothetical protein